MVLDVIWPKWCLRVLRWSIPQIKAKYPNIIFIAEIYNPSQYQISKKNCFDYLYDKVGFYDVLRDVSCGYELSDISTLNNVGDIQDKCLILWRIMMSKGLHQIIF